MGKINKKRSVLTNAACRDELDVLNHCTLKRRMSAPWPFYCRVTKGSAVIEKMFGLGVKMNGFMFNKSSLSTTY